MCTPECSLHGTVVILLLRISVRIWNKSTTAQNNKEQARSMASFSAASPKDSNSSSFAKQHILSCSFQWLPQLAQSSAPGLCPHFHGHQWDWTKLPLEELSFSPITLFGNRCISNKEKSLSINKHAKRCGTAIHELAPEPEILPQTGREQCKR